MLKAAQGEGPEHLGGVWRLFARKAQLSPPGNWRVWVIRAGRGYGKTRSGAEWVREEIESGRRRRIALVGATAGDVRDVMVEGPSGILATASPWFRPVYEPSRRRIVWPNGAKAFCYSAEEPKRLRGPQHDGGWADELAAWERPDTWDQLMFGMRLGGDPRVVVTTTPRPTPFVKSILALPTTIQTTGTTYDNRAHLAPGFMDEIIRKYEGTRLGRQELLAELVEDVDGQLWTLKMLERAHMSPAELAEMFPPPEGRWIQGPGLLNLVRAPDVFRHGFFVRTVVAVDPAAKSSSGSNETGIIGGGLGADGYCYILGDRSGRLTPDGWGSRVVTFASEIGADRVVAEINNGGDMVESVIRTIDPNIPYKAVTASRGKAARAEPVAALYEQNRVRHAGVFSKLEDQMRGFTANGWEFAGSPEDPSSPDRADALVWLVTELMLGGNASGTAPHPLSADSRSTLDAVDYFSH